LTKKVVKAFAPGAISSFFEIFKTNPDGTPIADLQHVGARGGGFGLQLGVHTKITVEEAAANSVQVIINNRLAPEAKVTKNVTQTILNKVSKKYVVEVEHQIDVPIGMGFGTSAGGALTTCLALKEALNLPLTYNQIGRMAHLAEIQSQTGLGTVSSLSVGGGLILVTEPGAPGVCKIDRIPLSPDYVIVTGFYDTKISKTALSSSPSSSKQRDLINRYGRQALADILEEPNVENFLTCCWSFAQKAGFASERICELVRLAMRAGAVGASQNMIGEAVHAVVLKEKAFSVVEAFKQVLPEKQLLCCKVDLQGVRLVNNDNDYKTTI
jgi:pantoate kinase